MKKLLTTTLALSLVVAPAWAGDKGDKAAKKPCEQSAATCAQMMKEKLSQRGWVGINMEYDEERHVVAITNVVADSPAERAGFQVGDVLKALNGVEYTEENEKKLEAEYASFKPGNEVEFGIERGGERQELVVELEQIPDAILAQWIGQHILEHHLQQAAVADVDTEKGDETP